MSRIAPPLPQGVGLHRPVRSLQRIEHAHRGAAQGLPGRPSEHRQLGLVHAVEILPVPQLQITVSTRLPMTGAGQQLPGVERRHQPRYVALRNHHRHLVPMQDHVPPLPEAASHLHRGPVLGTAVQPDRMHRQRPGTSAASSTASSKSAVESLPPLQATATLSCRDSTSPTLSLGLPYLRLRQRPAPVNIRSPDPDPFQWTSPLAFQRLSPCP